MPDLVGQIYILRLNVILSFGIKISLETRSIQQPKNCMSKGTIKASGIDRLDVPTCSR